MTLTELNAIRDKVLAEHGPDFRFAMVVFPPGEMDGRTVNVSMTWANVNAVHILCAYRSYIENLEIFRGMEVATRQ